MPMPDTTGRVEVVHNATIMGEWAGPEWWTADGEIDLAAVTEYSRKLPRGSKLIIDIERKGAWNADLRDAPIDGFILRATQMIEAVHAAANEIQVAFYDCFRESYFQLVDRIVGLNAMQAANDELAPVVDIQDFYAAKFYGLPGKGAAETRKAVNAYADEGIRTARGKPLYMLVSGTAYNPPTALTAAARTAQAEALAARKDIAGVIWWGEKQWADAMRSASAAMATAMRVEIVD